MSRPKLFSFVIALLMPGLLAPALGDAQSSQGGLIAILGSANPKLLSTQGIPVRLAGQLTVDFHGDAASGCASRGLCGYTGTVTWRPPATGSIEILAARAHGRLRYYLALEPGGGSTFRFGGATTASVHLSTPAAAGSNCLDASSTGGSLTLPVRNGRVAFTLTDTSPSLITTRCAGPLESDIASELPAPALPLAAVEHGRTTVPLGASSTFSSHGFAGTLTSTLSVALGRPGRRIPVKSGAQAFPKGIATERYRELEVTYRASLHGSTLEEVHGDSNSGVCSLLGSCGLSGTITLTAQAKNAPAYIDLVTPARWPALGLPAAAGLNRGRATKGIVASGGVLLSAGGELAAGIEEPGTTCTDSAPVGGGSIILAAAKGRLHAEFPALGGGLRTRCPGPEGSGDVVLAAGDVPLPWLRRRTIVMALSSGPSFFDYGYDIRPVAHLTLTLTRVKARSRVVVEPKGFP